MSFSSAQPQRWRWQALPPFRCSENLALCPAQGELSSAAAWVRGGALGPLGLPRRVVTAALDTRLAPVGSQEPVWGRGLGGRPPESRPLAFLLWLYLVGGMNKKATGFKKKKEEKEMNNTLWNMEFCIQAVFKYLFPNFISRSRFEIFLFVCFIK